MKRRNLEIDQYLFVFFAFAFVSSVVALIIGIFAMIPFIGPSLKPEVQYTLVTLKRAASFFVCGHLLPQFRFSVVCERFRGLPHERNPKNKLRHFIGLFKDVTTT